MAERYYNSAGASGNWSTTANWDGGVAQPGAGDDVYANGKTVTIDQDVTCLSIRTDAGATAAAGGGFTASAAGRNITLTGAGVVPGSTVCLTVTNTTGTVTVAGNVTGSQTTNTTQGVSKSLGAGAVAVVGTVTGGSGTNRHGVQISIGTVTVTGNVTGGSAACSAVIFAGAATLTVTGAVTGGSAAGAVGVTCGVAGTVTVIGNVTGGGNATAYGMTLTGAGTFVVTGDLIPAAANAVNASGAGRLTVNGNFQSVGTGVAPVGAGGFVLLVDASAGLTHKYRSATGGGAIGAERTLSTGGGGGGGITLISGF